MPRHDDYDRYDSDPDIRIGLSRERLDEEYPHSGAGILSMVIAVVVFFGYMLTFGAAAIMESGNNAPRRDDDPATILLGLTMLTLFFANFIGLVLGIVGCCQPSRKTLFAVLGSSLNVLVLLAVMFLVCIGLAIG